MIDDLVENRVGRRGPNERLRAFVVNRKVLGNRVFESCNARERSAPNAPPRDLCEKALDAIEPARACRREVKLESWMCGKLAAHRRRLVRPVIVKDQMNDEVFRHLLIDTAQEAKKLLVPVTPVACADHFARCNVERREQRRDTVTGVVVRLSLGYTRPHRKDRLRSIEGLDLGLLVDAQHNSSFGRRHIEPDHISNFFNKERIRRVLESLRSVRLQSKGLPNAMHRGG